VQTRRRECYCVPLCGTPEPNRVTDHDRDLRDPDACSCDETLELRARIAGAIEHLQHRECPQNNSRVIAALRALR
jgi:hypothetical protein